MITIYPPIKKSISMNQITVRVFELKLFEYVKICVVLYDYNGNAVDNRVYTIDTTNGYNDWNNDDKFIIEWVKKQLQDETNN